ncbi:MAG: ABC transporter permease [Gemmataceae bacterium]
MSYAISTLWHERQRYLPGVLAVGFSALLIALQCGLLLGMFSVSSMAIDRGSANIWMGSPNVPAVDLGLPIREGYIAQLASQPEVERCEVFMQGFSKWNKPDGVGELCMIIGSRLGSDSLGAIRELKERPDLMDALTEPGAVVIDESDKDKLRVTKVGDLAEVVGVRVKVVGFTRGIKSLAGPYVFCSVQTARPLLRYPPDQVTYVLGKTRRPEDAAVVARRLARESHGTVTAITAADFSYNSQMHWLLKTKAGIALGYAAALGLLVGAVVTSQTLYAATAASLREFAVLRALGIPRWRMAGLVLSQAFWVGVIGVCAALPAVFGAAQLAEWMTVQVKLPPWLLTSAVAITLGMAMISGLAALRSLRGVEPAALLR